MIDRKTLEQKKAAFLASAVDFDEKAKANRWAAQGIDMILAEDVQAPPSAPTQDDVPRTDQAILAPEKPRRGRPPGKSKASKA